MKFNKFLQKALSSLTIISSLGGLSHVKAINKFSNSNQTIRDNSKIVNNSDKQLFDCNLKENEGVFRLLMEVVEKAYHIIQRSSVSYLDGGQTVQLRDDYDIYKFNLKLLNKLASDDRKKEVYSEICQRIIESHIDDYIPDQVEEILHNPMISSRQKKNLLHSLEISLKRYKKLDLKYIKSNMNNAVKELLLQSENRPNESKFKYEISF